MLMATPPNSSLEGKGLGGGTGSTARPPTQVGSSARSWADGNCHLAVKPMALYGCITPELKTRIQTDIWILAFMATLFNNSQKL